MEIYYLFLTILRKVYLFFFPIKRESFILNTNDADMASDRIYNLLVSNKPCIIARFGATETNVLKNYIGINHSKEQKFFKKPILQTLFRNLLI